MSEASAEFWDAIQTGGSHVQTCTCGRVHFATHREEEWDSQRELSELRRKAASSSDWYVENTRDDSIASACVSGVILVWGCPCGTAAKYEAVFWQNRAAIIKYLKARTAREQAELANRAAGLDEL